ncbi:hypothetical protein D3C76_1082370 [compost metagenome]
MVATLHSDEVLLFWSTNGGEVIADCPDGRVDRVRSTLAENDMIQSWWGQSCQTISKLNRRLTTKSEVTSRIGQIFKLLSCRFDDALLSVPSVYTPQT